MAQNINCKKKWHPSRYETQTKVKEAEESRSKNESEMEERKKNGRRETLASEIKKTTGNRMRWML